MFITPTMNSFEQHTPLRHYDPYTVMPENNELPYGTLKKRASKRSCSSGPATKESVRKRLVAKILKILTVKGVNLSYHEKNESVAKLKKCIARNAKLYAAATATGGRVARWRRYTDTSTGRASCPQLSISTLSLNFEPLLPTIIEETESQLRDDA